MNEPVDRLLAGLRAAGEPTRLRLLALCAHAELSVGELVEILGQSQPRISRHLKLLVEGGLLERFREGVLVFYRLAENGETAILARTLVDLLPPDDGELGRDLARFERVRERRVEVASAYFEEIAGDWDQIRALHVPEEDVESRLRQVVGRAPIGTFLDIGTGTGRILELFADQFRRGLGVDMSAGMLAVARARLEGPANRHLQLRKGDMYALSIENGSVDLAMLHLVLHYSDEPDKVIAEAARTLEPGGRLVVVDFASHSQEHLREDHRHRRLGFADREIRGWMSKARLEPGRTEVLAGNPLTVNIWHGEMPVVPARTPADDTAR